ncbi:hypothetical protein DFH09DRAFT_323934 [Mycena vulgaris]|nr:hypothetical protein DFH09DRAFT_323934 [Mycena vulgaris]
MSAMSISHCTDIQDAEHQTRNMESRYIYYRFYSPSSAIVSRNAFDAADPFLGRIKMTAIAPPRTIDSLKRCVAQAENLNDPTNQRTELYVTSSSDSPIRNGTLPVGVDLGASPQSAVAFVLRQAISDAEQASVGGIRVPDNFRISPGILECRRRTQGVEPRYIYYRVYTPEKAIPSSGAFHPKDGFLGRMDVTRIPPPHTVATLSRCLADAEKLGHQYVQPLVFLTAASETPMPGGEKFSILGGGAGASPDAAIALVLSANPGLRPQRAPESTSGPNYTQYLYYRLYTRGGETASKTAFDPHDRALGRIDRNHITPPHTVAAIRRSIAKVEENARFICGALYADNSTSVPFLDNAPVSLAPGRSGLGMSASRPVVLVEQERREGVFNRPVQCMISMDRSSNLPGWLMCARGEIVFTDGILKEAVGGRNAILPVAAFSAVAANKHRGCEYLLNSVCKPG